MTADTPLSGYSVTDLSRRWRVSGDKIRSFIRKGELVAVNMAANLSARPQWRITPESVEQFEKKRSSNPPPSAPRRRSRPALVDYYP